jgi:hypothetical protein
METTVAMDAASDPRRARIWALTQTLRGDGFAPEVAETDPTALTVPANRAPVTVRCDHRASDGGTLWWYFPGGHAIAPADDAHIADAVAAIKNKVEERM